MQHLCEFQDVNSQHKNDFGVVDISFHIALKPDAELKKQRIKELQIACREKIKTFLDQLETFEFFGRVGLDAAGKKLRY